MASTGGLPAAKPWFPLVEEAKSKQKAPKSANNLQILADPLQIFPKHPLVELRIFKSLWPRPARFSIRVSVSPYFPRRRRGSRHVRHFWFRFLKTSRTNISENKNVVKNFPTFPVSFSRPFGRTARPEMKGVWMASARCFTGQRVQIMSQMIWRPHNAKLAQSATLAGPIVSRLQPAFPTAAAQFAI